MLSPETREPIPPIIDQKRLFDLLTKELASAEDWILEAIEPHSGQGGTRWDYLTVKAVAVSQVAVIRASFEIPSSRLFETSSPNER